MQGYGSSSIESSSTAAADRLNMLGALPPKVNNTVSLFNASDMMIVMGDKCRRHDESIIGLIPDDVDGDDGDGAVLKMLSGDENASVPNRVRCRREGNNDDTDQCRGDGDGQGRYLEQGSDLSCWNCQQRRRERRQRQRRQRCGRGIAKRGAFCSTAGAALTLLAVSSSVQRLPLSLVEAADERCSEAVVLPFEPLEGECSATDGDSRGTSPAVPSSPTFIPQARPMTSAGNKSIHSSPQKHSTNTATGIGIGDGMRSASSASRFFRSIDYDGDGTLEAPELATFLRNTIGGADFDTQAEVDTEVKNVLQTLDRDHDAGLDREDMFAYWAHLESLLTADEVAEWVVHAVQLPEYVGRIFKDNAVTGYDFPELVENDGDTLLTELNIEKSSFRKKLVRHIRARMLGVGTVPTPPSKVQYNVESCSTATFSWNKSTARGFPVHSYRVQRRAVDLHGDNYNDNYYDGGTTSPGGGDFHTNRGELCGAEPSLESLSVNALAPQCGDSSLSGENTIAHAETSSVGTVPSYSRTQQLSRQRSSSSSTSEWVTVYCGGESEFVDTGLELGYNYVYRIQAWNSVGRSSWVTVDISSSLKKQKCTAKKNTTSKSRSLNLSSAASDLFFDDESSQHWSFWLTRSWSYLSGPVLVAKFVIIFIRGILTLLALAATVMRFRRAAASSTTATKLEPMFPWLWKGINAFTLRVSGVEVIPKSMLGDKNSLRRQESEHDKSVKAVGLNGYKPSSVTFDNRHHEDNNKVRSRRDLLLRQRKAASTGDLSGIDGVVTKTNKTSSAGLLHRRNSFRNLRKVVEDEVLMTKSEGEIAPTTTTASGEKFPFDFQRSTSRLSIQDSCASSEESETLLPADTELYGEEDDHKRCNTCHKRYKFGKRWRHHCARCLSTFCHKHGRTTHPNFTSCKVPGTCVCNVCLELEQLHKRLSE